ncbi:MAG: nuclease-related domain-containing protein [Steroidobacteraceae bacterium]
MTHLIVAVVAVLSGIGIGLLIAWGWRRYRLRRQRLALVARITSVSVDHVRDVMVQDGNGGVLHLDFVLLTPRGILVIDLRDVSGNVFGSDQMSDWTVMDGAQRFTFTNPQSALYDRVAAVRAIAGSVPVEGRIVFTRRAVFPKGLPRFTLGEDSMLSDYPLGDRVVAEQAAGQYRTYWENLKSQLAPSPLAKG